MSDFEPKVIGFLCNWCSYAGADLCGVSRFQYPPNIRVVRVMCSTRVDPAHILKVLRSGADGVFLGGCHIGDCHYLTGNYHTQHKVKMAQKLAEMAGLDPKRIRLEWVSASEGERFSKVVTEFTEEIKGLGPITVKTDEGLQKRLDAAIEAAKGQRLRTLVGNFHVVTEVENTYGQKIDKAEFENMFEEAIDWEYHRNLILDNLLTEAKSVKQVAKEIHVPANKVLQYLISLRIENKVGDAGHEGFSPLYIALKAGGD
jgi:coenzyme F420-reducing hydrogenase delta subunit